MFGCNETQKRTETNLEKKTFLETYNDMQIQNAIISQHSLFPYHFVNNSKELNELGERDLAVLACHFLNNPGALNVRLGNANQNLYWSRVSYVERRLQEKGIGAYTVPISDGMAGGPAMTSEEVYFIFEAETDTSVESSATYTHQPMN
jgi:hypothetical protein